ncbi:rCG57495 [Rattus norvegicus]|uniref:RCG57495 n=1 Tax=Rattus norvegicus TaxID=10116 RepID=A6JHV9_RAT|nr:rCG57495 [Rattus norvegicus]
MCCYGCYHSRWYTLKLSIESGGIINWKIKTKGTWMTMRNSSSLGRNSVKKRLLRSSYSVWIQPRIQDLHPMVQNFQDISGGLWTIQTLEQV